MSKRILLEIKSDFKGMLLKRRKDFVNHLLQILNADGNVESEKELLKMGTRVILDRDNGSTLTVILDGETIYKD